MRPLLRKHNTLLFAVFLLPSITVAINLDCESIVVDGAHFNLKPLAGVHSLSFISPHPPVQFYNNLTLDICAPLKKPKNAPPGNSCHGGTRVCNIQYALDEDGQPESTPIGVIDVAGQYSTSIGGDIDPKYTRLKTSSSSADSQHEGLRMELHGGRYEGQKQKAIIEFLCIKDGEGETEKREQDDGKDKDDQKEQREVDDGKGGRLKFMEWDSNREGVAKYRLEWSTKYACEDAQSETGKSGGWGFFSWFFFIMFLAFVAYIIFGSWLNYSRYGARGWDLVPHGDTIRDVPYVLQDWFRKVVDTVQGGHTRGGYSAV